MQNRCARTDFGQLLARSWQVFGKGLGASFPIVLLCMALPVFAVLAAVYIGIASAFEPALYVLQTMLRSLLENGFDEWALGAAMEQVQRTLGGLNLPEVLLRMVGSLGITALVLLVLLPLFAVCRLVLMPIGRGVAMQVQLCALRGEKARFSQAFSAAKKKAGRLMALELLTIPLSAVVLAAAGFALQAISGLPVAGSAVALAVCLAALTVIGCVRHLAALSVVDEDARAVDALSGAVRRFFTDWAYLASGSLFYAGLLGGAVLIAAADVLLMVLALLPPAAVLLFAALFLPLFQAICAVMYEEQNRRAAHPAPQSPEL